MEPAEPFRRNRIIPRGQIAIEPAAPSVPFFRDFVHCRFADAGRWCAWLRPSCPASANLYMNCRERLQQSASEAVLAADYLSEALIAMEATHEEWEKLKLLKSEHDKP
jgi:hypothetical protein